MNDFQSKVITRVPQKAYSYVEVHRACKTKEEESSALEEGFKMIKDNPEQAVESFEAVLTDFGMKCPVCGEPKHIQVGISQATHKPYCMMKCANNTAMIPKKERYELFEGKEIQLPEEELLTIKERKDADGKTFFAGIISSKEKEDRAYCGYVDFINVGPVNRE